MSTDRNMNADRFLDPSELEDCIERLIPIVRVWGTSGIEEAVKEMDRRVAAGEENYCD